MHLAPDACRTPSTPCPTMQLQVVLTADDLVDYLQTAHHYALRIITSAIIAAFTVPPSQALEMLQVSREMKGEGAGKSGG